MPDVTVTLGADAAEFKQALTEIQKSVDSLVNSTTAKTAQLGLAFSGVKDMVSTAFAAIDGAVQKAFDFVAPSAAIQRVERVSIHALVRVRLLTALNLRRKERFQSTHS